MRAVFILLIGSIISYLSYSQEIKIINSTTYEPIEHVAIFNQTGTKSILTDENGKASVHDFSESDTLNFQHPSFVRVNYTYKEAVSSGTIHLTRKVIILPEYVISASKYQENQRFVPHMIDVITPKQFTLLTSQTSADILSSTGNVMVQKSQGGGGSPVLRGFEANKILLVIDGVRMNNAIYRSGHLQNSITIDNSILEKTEIIYGPNALMYGSDALGGVIHYITRDPQLASEEEEFITNAEAYLQLASANSSWKTHINFNVASKHFGSLTSITYADYGDIRMGTRRDPFLEDYGKCFYYMERINGMDSIVENDDPNIQRHTGYSQIDFFQKFRYKPSSKVDLIANLQYSTSSDIPRYDMLNDTSDNGDLKYAVWNYGPQNRIFGSLKSVFTSNNFFFNNLTATNSYQNIQESRIDRKYRSNSETTQLEKVNIYTLNIDMIKELSKSHRLIYGFETNFNWIASEAYMRNIVTEEESRALSRYPDDGSSTASYASYLSLKSELSSKFITSIGVRYSYSNLNARYSDFVSDTIPYKSIAIQNSSYTGSLGLIFLPSEDLKTSLLLSTGYRVPNLDDLAKIRAKGDQITFPNPYVDPEYTYNAELGISKTFDGYIQINGNYFVSFLTNVIVRVPYTFENGSDTMFYDGEWLKTFVNDNSNEGIIHGFSLSLISDLNSNISFKGTLNYTYGRDLSQDEPLSHIPPVFGMAYISYEIKKFTNEFYFTYSGWKKIEDMTTTGEDNAEEATKYGFQGWYTINFRTNYQIDQNISIQFALENVMDNFYKTFATAVASPGINFIGTLRIRY